MRRVLYIGGGVIVALLVLVVIALEALKAGVGKDRIAAALSGALGMPVTMGGLSVSLIPSPSLQATDVRIGGTDRTAAPGIAVSSLHVVPQLLSLVPGRTPTISHADLVGLVLSIRRTASGRWEAPVPPPTGAPAGAASGRGAPSPVAIEALRVRDAAIRVVDDSLRAPSGGPTITTISAISADLSVQHGTVSLPQFTGRLGQTQVAGSAEAGPSGIALRLTSPSIHNADLPGLFALAGMAPYAGLSIDGRAPVELSTHIGADFATLTASGKASIDRVTLATITLQQLQAPFRLEHRVLTLDPITFSVYGGREQGGVTVDVSKSPPQFTLRTSIQGLDVNQALSANTTMKDFLFGTAKLQTNVRGSGTTQAALEQSLAGTLQFAVENGDIRNFPVLAAINQAFGITQGSTTDTKFQSLSGTATIGGGQARSSDLTLHAGELSMLGQGTFGFDKTVDLHLTAVISAAKAAQLAQVTPLAKRLENDRGEITVPVLVTGSATAPKITVDVQAIAKQQLPGALQNQIKKNVPSQLQNQLQQLLPKP
jgi:uncharacterized protein involved in outer membrane biogenesis